MECPKRHVKCLSGTEEQRRSVSHIYAQPPCDITGPVVVVVVVLQVVHNVTASTVCSYQSIVGLVKEWHST